MSCVYKHTFPNGAVYIGKTNMHPEDRWLNGWGYKNSPLMFNAIVKYGWDNVKHEILVDNIDEQLALKIESQQIILHSVSNTMYNTAQMPPESMAQEAEHFLDPLKPKIHSKETTSRSYYKNHIIPLTPKPNNSHSCSIDVYTTRGEFICNYPSAKIAAQELGVNNGDVISCCKGIKSNGQPRYQVKGYVFRYGKS